MTEVVGITKNQKMPQNIEQASSLENLPSDLSDNLCYNEA
jgi:hypothetical protein